MAFNIPSSRYAFEALPDYFVFTDPAVRNDELPAIPDNFGLRPGATWRQLLDQLRSLNARSAQTKEHYKLVFAARHGEGDHNVAEAKYGVQAWDDHWSLLTGDGQATWGPDPHLTAVGEGQAHDAQAKWSALLRADNDDPPPFPTRFFASPLVRSARTLQLTYDGIAWPAASSSSDAAATGAATLVRPTQERPLILECLREDFRDRHTCDERSRRSEVAKHWEPLGWRIQGPMDEDDTLFASDYKESKEGITERLADALAVVWDLSEGHDVINITSHSGAMQALCRAVQHDDFKAKTGGMITLFIKATER